MNTEFQVMESRLNRCLGGHKSEGGIDAVGYWDIGHQQQRRGIKDVLLNLPMEMRPP